MEKFKAIIKSLWLPVAAFALWILYKIFVKQPEDQNGDEDFNNTTINTGLSANDLELFNQTLANLRNAVPYQVPSFSFTDILTFNPISQVLNATDNYTSSQGALELAEILNKVNEKHAFAEAFQKKQKCTLDSAIVKGYGNVIYQMISSNVTNFNQFII